MKFHSFLISCIFTALGLLLISGDTLVICFRRHVAFYSLDLLFLLGHINISFHIACLVTAAGKKSLAWVLFRMCRFWWRHYSHFLPGKLSPVECDAVPSSVTMATKKPDVWLGFGRVCVNPELSQTEVLLVCAARLTCWKLARWNHPSVSIVLSYQPS